MAWTVTFAQDFGAAGSVGTATAVWNKGLADEFSFSARVDDGTGGIGEFVRAAKAALKQRDGAVAMQEPVRLKIETRLNQ